MDNSLYVLLDGFLVNPTFAAVHKAQQLRRLAYARTKA